MYTKTHVGAHQATHVPYCKHGVFVGDPYGPDYMCWACESGLSVEDVNAMDRQAQWGEQANWLRMWGLSARDASRMLIRWRDLVSGHETPTQYENSVLIRALYGKVYQCGCGRVYRQAGRLFWQMSACDEHANGQLLV